MRAGHRCSADGVGGGRLADPSSGDVTSRGEHANALSVVGEVRANVGVLSSNVGSSDGDSISSTCGRRIASIRVLVTGSNDDNNTLLESVVNSGVESNRFATT